MPFRQLKLIEPLLAAVQSEGYTIPTDIQTQAIPHVLAGRDLLGCAQTGTGKTAAFALPILQRLHLAGEHAAPRPDARPPGHGAHPPGHGGHAHPGGRGDVRHRVGPSRPIRALVLTPTRELAAQIGESFRVYGQNLSLRHTVIFGGVKQGPQTQALHRGVDVLVATPGRLLDLLNQRLLTISTVEVFVLDEADRMLDMGFIHDIRRVIAQLPARRQTLLFSATVPGEIRQLASTLLRDPVYVKVAAESPAADTVKQSLYFVEPHSKAALLEQLLQDPQITRALVFTRTKHGADKVVRRLAHASISAEAIHSNKSQNARTRALDHFKTGATRVLVASDIAARGLDVEEISHVINFDLPNVAETYVHRIGRTGRAGASGQAISFCSEEQRDDLREIEKLLGRSIPRLQHSVQPPPPSQTQGQRPGAQRSSRPPQTPGGHVSQRPPTPEQQKDAFWQGRSRGAGRGWGGKKFRRRRR